MTTQTEKQLRVLFWTVLAGLILLTAPKLGGQVVFRPEFDTRLNVLDAKVQEVRDIALDNLCATQPSHRRCK